MRYWPIKLIPETKIHGGKTYLCRRIFEAAPQGYKCFLDGFMGAGSMTYNAPPGLLNHIACETNWERWNVKTIVRDRHSELFEQLKDVVYSEAVFEATKRLNTKDLSPLFCAARHIIVNRMSRGGLGQDFAWSDRERGGQPGDVNAWETMLHRLKYLSDRLSGVTIYNGSYRPILLEAIADPDWFVYLDPTYHPDCRSSHGEYGLDEMTHWNHVNLVNLVRGAKCKIAISHYEHELYESLNWRTVEFDVPNHSGQGHEKQRRIERLYMNYEA